MHSIALIPQSARTLTVTLSPEALASRDALVAEAEGVERVVNDHTLMTAVALHQRLSRALKDGEAARKTEKEPALVFGRAIDTVHGQWSEPLVMHKARIGQCISAYQEAQAKAAADAEQRRLAELRRIEAEERKLTAQVEQGKMDAAQANEAALVLAQKAAATLVPAEVPKKVVGLVSRDTWNFEITNRTMAYAAHPEWFDLVERKRDIVKFASDTEGKVEVPGLRFWKTAGISTRS